MLPLLLTVIYIGILFLYSHLATGRKANNDTFFRGERKSPWYMVAIGMVGASISGVTFVSVPGMVGGIGLTYLQTCLGFIVGYMAVAFILLPLYYRQMDIDPSSTTIYSYLDRRLGGEAKHIGALFFLVSKMSGAALRFYVVCFILYRYAIMQILPAPMQGSIGAIITVITLVALIWLYTRRGGIKTLVWTDTLQTICMFLALAAIIYKVMQALNINLAEAADMVFPAELGGHSTYKWFVFNDWISPQNFWKQFLSGVFIVIVMTGLDQDMMQKNLTCKTLRDAQKDMCTYGLAFLPANLLFLSLGVLLTALATQQNIPLPATSDELLPMFAATGMLGNTVTALFTVGMIAAAFSSADSALTSMTTTLCTDILHRSDDEQLRKRMHPLLCCVFALIIILVSEMHADSIIDVVYTLCSYTYAPLLALFSLAMLGKVKLHPKRSWIICLISPLLAYLINLYTTTTFHYHFGYELLLLNAFITFIVLWMCSRKSIQ